MVVPVTRQLLIDAENLDAIGMSITKQGRFVTEASLHVFVRRNRSGSIFFLTAYEHKSYQEQAKAQEVHACLQLVRSRGQNLCLGLLFTQVCASDGDEHLKLAHGGGTHCGGLTNDVRCQ